MNDTGNKCPYYNILGTSDKQTSASIDMIRLFLPFGCSYIVFSYFPQTNTEFNQSDSGKCKNNFKTTITTFEVSLEKKTKR